MTQGYDGTIRFDTKIDDSDLGPDLEKVKGRLQSAAQKMRDIMQGPVALFNAAKQAIGAIAAQTSALEAEWKANETAVAILNATLKATGANSWTTSKAVQEMANKFQALTGYADDTILSMQNVLLGFKNIKGDNFEAASLQIINMARVMRMDLSSAAQAVGKALDDPIAGIDSLTRQGFRWTEQEKAMLKEMVQTGKTAEAQKIIIDALATTFGGAAEAANQTASAIKDKLNVAQGELKEEMGRFLTEALKPLRQELIEATGRFTEWFKALNENGNAPQILEGIAIGLASVTGGIIAFMAVAKGHAIISALATALKAVGAALTANPLGLIAAAITMVLIPAIIYLVKNWDLAVAVFNETIAKLKASFSILASKIEEAFVVGFNGAKIAVLSLAQAVTGPVLNGIAKLLEVLGKLPFVGGLFDAAAASVRGFNAGLQGSIDTAKADAAQAIKTAKAKQDAIEATRKAEIAAVLEAAAARKAAREAAAREAAALKTSVDAGLVPGPATDAAATGEYIPKGESQGERLKDLDTEYAARKALAERNGEDTAAIEKKWYEARLKLLGDFVVEDAKKGTTLDESLAASLKGYTEDGSAELRKLGTEIDATRGKLEDLAAASGDGMFTPIDWDAANKAWNGEGAESLGDKDVKQWAADFLGAAAFKNMMDAAERGRQYEDVDQWSRDYLGAKAFDAAQSKAGEELSAAEADEWVKEYLGKQAYEELMKATEQGLQDADIEEWTREYLGKQAWTALMNAAEEGLQAADVKAWSDEYLGDKVFKSMMDAATQGLQNAEVAEWASDFLGAQAFKELQDAAEQGLQSAAVEEWADKYLGDNAFKALQDAAEMGLQAADLEEWVSDYLGKQVFEAMSKAAELGLQEADVAEWVANYLNEKKLANALDAEDMKIQAANVAAWVADYKKNHGTVEEGGDGWVSYDRYLEEMSQKASPFYHVIENIKDAWNGLTEDIKADAGDWGDVLGDVYNTLEDQIAGSLETMGRAIVEGSAAWDGFGTAALRSLAGVLRSVGYQLLAQAAYNAALGITHLLLGDIAGAAAAAASALVTGVAAAAAFVGAGVVEALAGQYDEANEAVQAVTESLDEQNDALEDNRDLFTKAGKAATAYAAVLAKVTKEAASFYESLQDTGAQITQKIIDGLTQGFAKEDFLYSMQEYITESVIKAAVFTDAFVAEAAAIGKEIAAGIAGGFSSDKLQGLKDRLAGLYEQAALAAEVATGIVSATFGSYDVGTLNVRGDQLAQIHNREMILEPGIAEQARTAGVFIGPVSVAGNVGRGAISPAPVQFNITATGELKVDGREIGRVAWRFSDEFQGAAYGR